MGSSNLSDSSFSFIGTLSVEAAGMSPGFILPMTKTMIIMSTANRMPQEMPPTSACPIETFANRQNMMMGMLGGMSTDSDPAQVIVPMDSVSS